MGIIIITTIYNRYLLKNTGYSMELLRNSGGAEQPIAERRTPPCTMKLIPERGEKGKDKKAKG